jgi:hypothetical protein
MKDVALTARHATEPLFSVAELARHLKLGESTIRAWGTYLDPPCLRIGKHRRFRLPEVIAWIERGGPNGLVAAMRDAAARRKASA